MKLFFCHACDGDQTLTPLTKGGKSRGGGEAFPQCFCIWNPWFPTSNEASPSWKGTTTHWATKNIPSHPMKYWLVNDRILYFIDIFHNFPLKKDNWFIFSHTHNRSIQPVRDPLNSWMFIGSKDLPTCRYLLKWIQPPRQWIQVNGEDPAREVTRCFFLVFGASLDVLGGKILWEVLS